MTGPAVVGILIGRAPEERYSTHRGYVASITAVGGVPILLPAGPDLDRHALTAVVALCQSIVVTGGGDVDPHHYGVAESAIPDELMDVDPARDVVLVCDVLEDGRESALAQGRDELHELLEAPHHAVGRPEHAG